MAMTHYAGEKPGGGMQYILSETELKDLKGKASRVSRQHEEKVQHLCTLVANYMPIVIPWMTDEPARPWGCILTQTVNGNVANPEYCDLCPVTDLCPYPHKQWSK